jgi:hypothetical protein
MGFIIAMAVVILGGYLIAAALGLPPGHWTTPVFLNASLFVNAVAAILGGVATVRFSPRWPRSHVYALAALLLLISLPTLFAAPPPDEPEWFNIVNSLIGPLFAILGGLIAAEVLHKPEGSSPG